MARQKKYKTTEEYKHEWYINNRERILDKMSTRREEKRVKNEEKKKCPVCKKIFLTSSKSRVFCSTICSKEGDRRRSLKFGDLHKMDKSLYDKEYRINNINRKRYLGRLGHLKRKFGLSVEEYNKMFEDQNGCCAICGRHQSEFNQSLHIDHCHSTGKIRGLLCRACNNGLGMFSDDINQLKNAIDYLESRG